MSVGKRTVGDLGTAGLPASAAMFLRSGEKSSGGDIYPRGDGLAGCDGFWAGGGELEAIRWNSLISRGFPGFAR
jgi:hypothetical protein